MGRKKKIKKIIKKKLKKNWVQINQLNKLATKQKP